MRLIALLLVALFVTACDRQKPDAPQAPAADDAQSGKGLDRSQKGKPAPTTLFKDPAGKDITIASFKGTPVLVNLWATWCAPCRKEMPALAALQTQLGSDDFEVVAISLDRKGIEASSVFLKETGATSLKLYVEPTARILNELEAIGLPATILIDRKGNEIGRLLGPAEWNSPDAIALIKAALAEIQG